MRALTSSAANRRTILAATGCLAAASPAAAGQEPPAPGGAGHIMNRRQWDQVYAYALEFFDGNIDRLSH